MIQLSALSWLPIRTRRAIVLRAIERSRQKNSARAGLSADTDSHHSSADSDSLPEQWATALQTVGVVAITVTSWQGKARGAVSALTSRVSLFATTEASGLLALQTTAAPVLLTHGAALRTSGMPHIHDTTDSDRRATGRHAIDGIVWLPSTMASNFSEQIDDRDLTLDEIAEERRLIHQLQRESAQSTASRLASLDALERSLTMTPLVLAA